MPTTASGTFTATFLATGDSHETVVHGFTAISPDDLMTQVMAACPSMARLHSLLWHGDHTGVIWKSVYGRPATQCWNIPIVRQAFQGVAQR